MSDHYDRYNGMDKLLSTNLAEVGTDCISKNAAIDALRGYLVGKRCPDDGTLTCRLIENEVINKLPPIQPDNNSEVPNSSDCISRQAAIDALNEVVKDHSITDFDAIASILDLPPAQPEIIRCKDCKLNPKYEWFGCPMSHLSEKQRPETAWCWKAERRTDERSD